MISVEAAKTLVSDYCDPLPPVIIPIAAALHRVLAHDTHAAIDMPGFDQSAMDGYAIRFADYAPGRVLPVVNESFAGSKEIVSLQPGTATRIFTGAPVPHGADTVVIQEHVTRTGDEILIDSPNLSHGLNVRKKGSEIKKKALALESGDLLTPAAIGFLASIGVSKVQAYDFPKVSIITTGKELVQPGEPLQTGQVYESNSLMLTTALEQLHVSSVQVRWADDDVAATTTAIQQALEQSDLILITGGVSVGDYDYVIPALEACGVSTVFHKVKQRPGKPLYFGKKGSKTIFGLPGNPSSVLSCFYQYVLLAIQKLMNRSEPFIPIKQLPIENAFSKNTSLTHFLKGYHDNEKVRHLAAQESYRLSSFALANCLIEIPADVEEVNSGDMVRVHVIG